MLSGRIIGSSEASGADMKTDTERKSRLVFTDRQRTQQTLRAEKFLEAGVRGG